MSNPSTAATALATVGSVLVTATTNLPIHLTAPVIGLVSLAFTVQLVLHQRVARVTAQTTAEGITAARERRERAAALEQEAIAVARTIQDPVKRADVLLGLAALNQQHDQNPPTVPRLPTEQER